MKSPTLPQHNHRSTEIAICSGSPETREGRNLNLGALLLPGSSANGSRQPAYPITRTPSRSTTVPTQFSVTIAAALITQPSRGVTTEIDNTAGGKLGTRLSPPRRLPPTQVPSGSDACEAARVYPPRPAIYRRGAGNEGAVEAMPGSVQKDR